MISRYSDGGVHLEHWATLKLRNFEFRTETQNECASTLSPQGNVFILAGALFVFVTETRNVNGPQCAKRGPLLGL